MTTRKIASPGAGRASRKDAPGRDASPKAGAFPKAVASRKGGASGARPARLGARDWLQAGEGLLREQGISAIKLSALTRRLGVSTGSFYHHFPDFETYLAELADSYSIERVIRDIDIANAAPGGAPLDRLYALGRQSVDAGTFELDRAMRIWATMDPRAEAAIRRAEALVLAFITGVFADLGFDARQAALRARILLSANMSPLSPPGHASHGEFVRAALDVLVGRGAAEDRVPPARKPRRAPAKPSRAPTRP